MVIVGSRLDDQRTSVNVSLRLGDPPKVRFSAGGTVTAVNLVVGQVVAQGDVLVSLDYVPVRAFISAAPLVRDLRLGDAGPDVAALSSYLCDIGLLDPSYVDSKFGSRVRSAVNAFQTSLGVKADGVFRTAYVAFLPANFGVPEMVSVVIGDSVAPGATLASGTPPVLDVEIQPTTEGRSLASFLETESVLLYGASSIEFGSYPPTAEGKVLISEWVSEVSEEAPSLTEGDAFDTARFEGLALALADPINYGTVPSSAVFQSSNRAYCLVLVDDEGVQRLAGLDTAVVVSSELGVVGVDSELIGQRVLREVQDVSPETLSKCR